MANRCPEPVAMRWAMMGIIIPYESQRSEWEGAGLSIGRRREPHTKKLDPATSASAGLNFTPPNPNPSIPPLLTYSLSRISSQKASAPPSYTQHFETSCRIPSTAVDRRFDCASCNHPCVSSSHSTGPIGSTNELYWHRCERRHQDSYI